jgi:prepilin-type N-terminal cleavage/methylation domain-containing protein
MPHRTPRGFTLVEIAVSLAIVSALLTGMAFTLSVQLESRNFEETRRRLDQARELVLGFALVNGRLPCPARSWSAGMEVRDAVTGQCVNGGVEDYYGGVLAGSVQGGMLPAATIGFHQVDGDGFATDAWQNRLRYAVSKTLDATTCTIVGNPHFVHAANLQVNGMRCQPDDLLVCKSAIGVSGSGCGGAANQIMTKGTVAALVFSTGRNGARGASSIDEALNLDGNATFVHHPPTPTEAVSGEFDDQLTWITVGELYGKLVSAGILP